MVVIRPYLAVNNALDAIELYKTIFEVEIVVHAPVEPGQEASMNIPEGTDLSRTTMHSTLKIGDAVFYLSDNFTGDVLEKTNMTIFLEVDSDEMAQTYFQRAEENKCRTVMKYQKQFWGESFGSFIDPFGISWGLLYSPSHDD